MSRRASTTWSSDDAAARSARRWANGPSARPVQRDRLNQALRPVASGGGQDSAGADRRVAHAQIEDGQHRAVVDGDRPTWTSAVLSSTFEERASVRPPNNRLGVFLVPNRALTNTPNEHCEPCYT